VRGRHCWPGGGGGRRADRGIGQDVGEMGRPVDRIGMWSTNRDAGDGVEMWAYRAVGAGVGARVGACVEP
jgi:hypothetical protein